MKSLRKKFNYLQFTPTQPIAMRVEELLEGVKAELAIKVLGRSRTIKQNSYRKKAKNFKC